MNNYGNKSYLRNVSHECNLMRDAYRRSLVTGIEISVSGNVIESLAYSYDALNRPTVRNTDTFGYNDRSEVTAANIAGVANGYDEIGNATSYTPNSLNQYTEFAYDLDGNLLTDGIRTFTYDAANHLKTVTTNGALALTNYYDAKSRRVRKVTPEATTTFFYDDWNLVEERVAYTNGTTSTIHYYWGKDISGTRNGAAGIGGLLYLKRDGEIYVPWYDAYGNILGYCDAQGNVVASYTYDAFGNIISQSGTMPDAFAFRFSTKYFDYDCGLYYYGYRYYKPQIMRWLTEYPLGVDGGVNVYGFCHNNSLCGYDELGLEWIIERNPSKRWAIARKSSPNDTFVALADKLRLDFSERAKWLRKNKGNPCLFEVPNVFCVYTSKSGWGDGVITFVTQLKRKAMSDAESYHDKGFKVISHKWANSGNAFYDMWTQDGIYAISFAGHGSKYGFIADNASGSAVNPMSVHPPYHLAAVRAYSCLSSTDIPGDVMLPDGTIPASSWKSHDSQRGAFFGYSGLVNWISQFWLKESTNAE